MRDALHGFALQRLAGLKVGVHPAKRLPAFAIESTVFKYGEGTSLDSIPEEGAPDPSPLPAKPKKHVRISEEVAIRTITWETREGRRRQRTLRKEQRKERWRARKERLLDRVLGSLGRRGL